MYENNRVFTFFILTLAIFALPLHSVATTQQNNPQVANLSDSTEDDALTMRSLNNTLNNKGLSLTPAQLTAFKAIYKTELSDIKVCRSQGQSVVKLCSNLLRNEGNGPYMLLPDTEPKAVAVLFHGLSDSPFFMKSIFT